MAQDRAICQNPRSWYLTHMDDKSVREHPDPEPEHTCDISQHLPQSVDILLHCAHVTSRHVTSRHYSDTSQTWRDNTTSVDTLDGVIVILDQVLASVCSSGIFPPPHTHSTSEPVLPWKHWTWHDGRGMMDVIVVCRGQKRMYLYSGHSDARIQIDAHLESTDAVKTGIVIAIQTPV